MSVIGVGQAVILGVVEGVTEFLPISSTGHLKIAEGLLGIPVQDAAVVGFTAVIQMGAIAAVLVYFFADLRRFVVAWGRGLAHREARRDRDYRFAWWVVFATVPIVVAGLLCQPLIKGPLGSLWVVAGALIVGSGVMWVAERVGTQARSEDDATAGRDAGGDLADLGSAVSWFLSVGGHHCHGVVVQPGSRGGDADVVLSVHPRVDRRRPL